MHVHMAIPKCSNAVWPITWGTPVGSAGRMGSVAAPRCARIGRRLQPDRRTTHHRSAELDDDLAGGLLKSGGGPVGYLSGVAVAQWGDVIAQTAQADFSASTLQTTTDYIATNPAGAFEAARDAAIGYIPKLFSNVLP
jgi:hypothetical protein